MAARMNRRACNAGLQEGCVNLAVQYNGGNGVPVDQQKSLSLNQRACDGGNAIACGNVGFS